MSQVQPPGGTPSVPAFRPHGALPAQAVARGLREPPPPAYNRACPAAFVPAPDPTPAYPHAPAWGAALANPQGQGH